MSVMSKRHDLRWNTPSPVQSPPTISGRSETDGFPEIYKMVEVHSLVSSAAVQLIPVLLSYLPNFWPGAVVISSSSHSISSCSSKLLSPSSPSGLSPSAPLPFRSPAPLLPNQSVSFPDRSPSHHHLTLVSFNSPRTRCLDAQARYFIRPILT